MASGNAPCRPGSRTVTDTSPPGCRHALSSSCTTAVRKARGAARRPTGNHAGTAARRSGPPTPWVPRCRSTPRAPILEQRVDHLLLLNVPSIDDQREMMEGHPTVPSGSRCAGSERARAVAAGREARRCEVSTTPRPDIPNGLVSPHRMTPQRCPDRVGMTAQPALSAAARASSTSFLGCRDLAMC